MAGPESEEYRPRRALPTSSVPGDARAEDPSPPAVKRPGSGSGAHTPTVSDEHSRAVSDEPSRAVSDEDDSTTILPRTRAASLESTTILPRTHARAERDRFDSDPYDDDEFDDGSGESGGDAHPMGQRTKTALLAAAVAVVVIVGLVIGSSLLALNDKPLPSPRPTGSASGASPSTSGSPTPDPNVLLSDTSMLTASDAKQVDPSRTWRVALTSRGLDDQSPQAACLTRVPVDGQPSPQQTILRLLSSSGKKAPGVLHEADAYATTAEAAQAYSLASKALGGCTMTGAYIDSGRTISGLGDQAVGLVLNVSSGTGTEFRSVIVNRTGRVVNVVDVAQADSAASMDGLAAGLATVTNVQCTTSGGLCAESTAVRPGPPPVGGDQPGFLATGDLPPASDPVAAWVGVGPQLPDPGFPGSGCETVDWATTPATSRTARTYLQENGGTFGLDEIIITLASDKAAHALVTQVKKDLSSCEKRKLTATVSGPGEVRGGGARGTEITGWTAAVSQKTSKGTLRYRVGIVSAGPKVVFVYLNPQKGKDVTSPQWDVLTVRAGQRATQFR